MVLICCIDGNIGAGKSTVLAELNRRGYRVFKEELTSWGWCLSNYYQDPKRWAFTLQMAILRSMANQYSAINADDAKVVFVERSPESGMIFTRNSWRHGNMTTDEMNIVGDFYKLFGWTPHITIKLHTPVELCLARVMDRNRACEKSITINYLRDLDREYETLNAIRIDGTVSAVEIADTITDIVS